MQKHIEKSNELARIFRIVGGVLAVIGVIILISNLNSFFSGSESSTYQEASNNAKSNFIGFVVGAIFLSAGSSLLVFGFQKKVLRYQSSQFAPVAKDVTNYMVDGTKDSVSDLFAETIKKSKEAYTDTSEVKEGAYCSKCGHEVEKDDIFCPNCGNKLK